MNEKNKEILDIEKENVSEIACVPKLLEYRSRVAGRRRKRGRWSDQVGRG